MAHLFLGNSRIFDPRYKVTVIGRSTRDTLRQDGAARDGFTVEGVLQNDLAVTGSNNYSDRIDVVEQAAGGLGGIIKSAVDTYSAAAGTGGAIRGALSGSRFVPVWESEKVWSGSGRPVFAMELTFVCEKSGDERYNVVNKVNQLMRGVYPDTKSQYFNALNTSFNIFTAPLGYSTNNSPLGKCELLIGGWFRAPLLVMERCSFSFSKEVNRDGRPIYATGIVELTPYRAISYDEYLGYFNTSRF